MSWSVQAVGKPAAVAASIDLQFAGSGPCAEPEESVRQAARALIASALGAQKPNSIVTATASGSMSRESWPDGPVSSTLAIGVTPLYGYVE